MTIVPDLLADLLRTEPSLQLVVDEHLADNNELFPHVLLGDVTRWVVEHAPATHVLVALERHLSTGDEDVGNLIAVSFLENLEPEDEVIRAALPRRLAAQLAAMES